MTNLIVNHMRKFQGKTKLLIETYKLYGEREIAVLTQKFSRC